MKKSNNSFKLLITNANESNRIKNEESVDTSTQRRKSKVNIFNNKKNNDLCSELLRSTMKNEKELILIPYAQKKQKINKTFHTIGDAHGIPYPNVSVVNGMLLGKQNYVNIIRGDDRKSMVSRKSKKLESSTSRKNMSRSPKSKTHTPKSNFEKNFNNSNSNVQEFNL